jgi:hypothetical protein
MKVFIVVVALLALACALPYVEQRLLANSMIVGKDDESDLLNWECNVCDASSQPIHAHYIEENEKDVKCILAVYDSFVVLAFRYTNTALNIWQDILYASQVVDPDMCSNCKIQKAYKKMWEAIELDVLADLRDIKAETGIDHLYITGISLGGGLAVISYIDIKNALIFGTVDVITYGAPRVANKNYAVKFDEITAYKTKRFIVKGDPVVVLPECLTILCNYKHTGNQYVCVEDEEVCRGCEAVPETFFEKRQWRKNADPSQKNLGSILDHIYGYKKIYNSTVIEC